MASKKALDAKRLNAFSLDPDDIVIIGVDTDDDETHPLWDKRAFDPLDENMVLNIMTYGVLQAVRVQKDGVDALCVAGRRRVLHAREAKRRQALAGEVTVMVPALVVRGDEVRVFGIARSENAHRRDDSPLTNAKNAQRMFDFGATEDDVAITFGVSVSTVKSWVSLLDADKSVRTAVERGELAPTAAAKLAKLPRDEQRTTLQQMRDEGKLTTAAAASVARSKKNGSNGQPIVVAPGKRTLKKLLDLYDKGESKISLHTYQGIAFAIGELEAAEVDGLADALKAVQS